MIGTFILLFVFGLTRAAPCGANPCAMNSYGPWAYKPWLTTSDDRLHNGTISAQRCEQKFPTARCEQSGVNYLNQYPCKLADRVNCHATKQNCNETVTCTDLIQIHDLLQEGGYNIICRHGKTYWQQYKQEKAGCVQTYDCVERGLYTQRNLQPAGKDELKAQAKAIKNMGIPVQDPIRSSPMTRTDTHGQIFATEFGIENTIDWRLMYMGAAGEVVTGDFEGQVNWPEGSQEDQPTIKARQASWIRELIGKKTERGKNQFLITHGFNIKAGATLTLDESACVIIEPTDELIGDVHCDSKINEGNGYTIDPETHKFEIIARLGAEAWIKMDHCVSLKDEVYEDHNYLSADTDNDMSITRDEFQIWWNTECPNAESGMSTQVFDMLDEMDSSLLGLDLRNDGILQIGQFYHMNWGWRSFKLNQGNLAMPWRQVLTDTIPETKEEMEAVYKPEIKLVSQVCNGKSISKWMHTIREEDKPIDSSEAIMRIAGSKCADKIGKRRFDKVWKSIKDCMYGPYYPLLQERKEDGELGEKYPFPAHFKLENVHRYKKLHLMMKQLCDGTISMNEALAVYSCSVPEKEGDVNFRPFIEQSEEHEEFQFKSFWGRRPMDYEKSRAKNKKN